MNHDFFTLYINIFYWACPSNKGKGAAIDKIQSWYIISYIPIILKLINFKFKSIIVGKFSVCLHF